MMDSEVLGEGLCFRQDSATHGVIEASTAMSLGELRLKIAATIDDWQEVLPQPQQLEVTDDVCTP